MRTISLPFAAWLPAGLCGILVVSGGCSASDGAKASASVASGGQYFASGGASGTPASSGASGGNGDPSKICPTVLSGSVTMSVPSGTFQGALSVALATTIANAEIRYTTNGQAPDATATLYDGKALNLTSTTRLRAQAFVQGTASGGPSAALYVSRDIDATHDIPVVILDSYGSGKLPTAEASRVNVDVAYLGYDVAGGNTSISARPTVASMAAFHVRGQSSAMFDKVPYRLELRDESGVDRDCAMFGMPSESDWALVGPHADKTLVHNAFVYDLGLELGMKAPRLRMVEVYVNVENRPLAASDYQGVYQLVEIIKNQKDRLDLKQLDETQTSMPEIAGGYIFKLEWKAAEPPLLPCPSGASNCWKDMEMVDPNPINQPQQDYLTQHLVSFNDALHGSNAADATTGYASFIDVRSFVDHVIVNEVTRNMDAYARSQYFHKDRDTKIFAGPLWDFDLIAGVGMTAAGRTGTSFANTAADGWQYEANKSRLAGASSDWFPVLIAEPAFRAQLVARWKELRGGPLSDLAIASRVDKVTAGLAAAAERNFTRWDILAQPTVSPFATPTEPTWRGQVEYMKSWLLARAAWIDGQWQ